MPNAAAHRLCAALAIGSLSTHAENRKGEYTAKPLAHATLAAIFATLPDLIEPACHPNHRRFFHSVVFAAVLGHGLYRLNQWETHDDLQKLLKTLGLIAGGAYLIHLAMDATTAKSLPLV